MAGYKINTDNVMSGEQQRIEAQLAGLGRTEQRMVDDAFKRYDTDNSGTITVSEFQNYLKLQGQEFDPNLFGQIFRLIDKDNSGKIDKGELASGMEMIKAAKIFDEMDTDNSQLINQKEWQTACFKVNKDWDMRDAELMFEKYDRSEDGSLDIYEFIDAMKEMQSQFICSNIQYRIDKTRDRVLRLEDSVKKLISTAGPKEQAMAKAKAARDKQAKEHGDLSATAKESGTQWEINQRKLAEHNAWSKDIQGNLADLRSGFSKTKSDLHKAFENKDWNLCVGLSQDANKLKWQIDELEGKHKSKAEMQEQYQKAMNEHGMSTKQADIELNKLGDMLADAEALFGGADAEYSGHMAELNEAKTNYALFQRQLAELEEEGCRANLSMYTEKYGKALRVVTEYNNRIVRECADFKTHFQWKRFGECKACAFNLMKYQKVIDNEGTDQDELQSQVRYWQQMLVEKNADKVMANGGPGKQFITRKDGLEKGN